MSTSNRLTAFALGLAATAMLVAAYAVLSRPVAGEGTACRCDTEALQAQLAALEQRVQAAERTAARGVVRRVGTAATAPARADDDGAPSPQPSDDAAPDDAPGTTPHFVEFKVSEPGITVVQADDGALSVRNTNAALVGQIVTVEAVGEDGQVRPIAVTVPPVE